jgi:hypothetical protein
MTWVRFLGYAAFSALCRVYQVVILDKILSIPCAVLTKYFMYRSTDKCMRAPERGIPSRSAAIIARLMIIRSKQPVASLSNIMRLRRSILVKSYVNVFICTAFIAWCCGRDPCCCFPKQLLSSPWYTSHFPQSIFKLRL